MAIDHYDVWERIDSDDGGYYGDSCDRCYDDVSIWDKLEVPYGRVTMILCPACVSELTNAGVEPDSFHLHIE